MRVLARRRALELVLLFFAAPAALTVAGVRRIIPLLLLVAVAALASLLAARRFDRRRLGRRRAIGREARRFVPRFLVLAALMTAVVAAWQPASLFAFPRSAPRLWLLVMVLYPLLSVYPQEIVFRAFLFHRYGPVFGAGTAIVWASALAFGWVHILFGNWVAVAMSAMGGWLFADTYRRSRSLLAAAAEHALYGAWLFTVGFGGYFYNGTVSFLSSP